MIDLVWKERKKNDKSKRYKPPNYFSKREMSKTWYFNKLMILHFPYSVKHAFIVRITRIFSRDTLTFSFHIVFFQILLYIWISIVLKYFLKVSSNLLNFVFFRLEKIFQLLLNPESYLNAKLS